MDERILYSHCPLCASSAIAVCKTGDCSRHPLYTAELSPAIHWKQCASCAHVFTEGYYTDAACALIFSKTHGHQKLGAQLEQSRVVSAHMVDKVLPFASDGAWLDIGFGNGSLLFTAQEYGFTPVGADLREDNVRMLARLGIEAHLADIAALKLASPCAVISMADVLEHMPYPKVGLAAAHRLLRSDGVVLISMPNSESMLWRAMDDQNANPYWGELEHYHNFSRTRLYALLAECGFAPRRYGVSERYRACMEVVAQKL